MGDRLRGAAIVSLASLLLVTLQVSIVSVDLPAALRPDLVVIAIVLAGAVLGPVPGATFGFAIAFLMAASVAGPPGMVSLAGALVGYWTGRWTEVSPDDDRTPIIVGTVVGGLMMQVGVPVLDAVLEVGSGPSGAMEVAGVLAVTGLLALPLHRLLLRLPGMPSTGGAAVRRGEGIRA